MITSDFTGNFGNHIFQYVVVRAIAERKGLKWGFTKHIYGDYFGGQSQMDFLDIDYGLPVEGIENEYQEKIVNIGGHTNVHLHHDFEDLKDNSKLVGCWQTEQYLDKEKVREWLKIKNEENFKNHYENTCVINVRGGEYRAIREVLLPKSYWERAIGQMHDYAPYVNFVVVTDDVPYAQALFPNMSCVHMSIAEDYYAINKAKYLILSNSSFAWMPAWLNKNVKRVIAPKYWARYNVSDGYWASSNIFTKGWMYLDREGRLQSYDEVVKELKNSKYKEYYNLGE